MSKKLTLRIEELEVESYQPVAGHEGEHGTVRAREGSDTILGTCPPHCTRPISCQVTCDPAVC